MLGEYLLMLHKEDGQLIMDITEVFGSLEQI